MSDKAPSHPAPKRFAVHPLVLAFTLFGSPVAWLMQMTVGEILSSGACRAMMPGRLPAPVQPGLLLVSFLAFVVALASGLTAWMQWRTTRAEKPGRHVVDTGEGRTRFLAMTGMLEAFLFLSAILITTIAMAGTPTCPAQALAPSVPPTGMSQGEYIAKLGDCVSCHSAPGKQDFAGGFPLHSPIGVIYGTNITPDPDYGIGKYTQADFRRALKQGIARDGHHLYPAMPYTSFTRMSDADIDALYDYMLHDVKPVHIQAPRTSLWFPFNQRWGLMFWNLFFRPSGQFMPQTAMDAQWNRGAYLVETVTHCGACHTPRGPAYNEVAADRSSSTFVSGSDVDKWYAANLTGDPASGLGRWSQADIAQFLATGSAHGGMAFGSMEQLVENSGQYMTEADRQAIARYIKTVPAHGENMRFVPDAPPPVFELSGAGTYAQECSGCHGLHGEGQDGKYPRLADNPIVLSQDPTSQVRLVLQGATTAKTAGGPPQRRMPGFPQLTDRQVADVLTYVRQNWGNNASSVDTNKVKGMRSFLKQNGGSEE